jgi:hypothetical protein
MTEYKLKHPIELGEESIETLKLEEPNIDKLELYNVDLSPEVLTTAGGMKRLLTACCTNVSEAHVGKMMASDLAGSIEVCQDFFG